MGSCIGSIPLCPICMASCAPDLTQDNPSLQLLSAKNQKLPAIISVYTIVEIMHRSDVHVYGFWRMYQKVAPSI